MCCSRFWCTRSTGTPARLADLIGPTGTTIIVRLSAFLLFCIGIQVFWNGAGELLAHLPVGAPGS